MKNAVKLNESQLKRIVAESVKKILGEVFDDGYLENIMVHEIISGLGLSESIKHELLSAT